MMKKMKILWALLPVAVALIVASCSSEDATDPTSGNNGGTKTIPVTITVGMDNATRATVGDDNSSLYFQTGDKLAVLYSGAQIALLDNTSIAEGSASATFQGNMTVPNAAESYGEVTVVLISQENVGVQTNNDYSWANSGSAICVASGSSTALNEAVKKYSYLKGTGPFNPAGQNNFTLTQGTAFLNFHITFIDGTNTNTPLTVTVKNGNTTIGSGSVTTTTEATNYDVVADFVVPVASGTTLDNASVALGSHEAISFGGSTTLDAHSYKIEKTYICPDGNHPHVIDLGLGEMWSCMNVGATAPDKYGLFYRWGMTNGYEGIENHYYGFTWGNYAWSAWNENDEIDTSKFKLTKYNIYTNEQYSADGTADNKTTLDSSDDAASANWGGTWRTPSPTELNELINNTNKEVISVNNVAGIKLTSTVTGFTDKFIFIPLAGVIASDYYGGSAGKNAYIWSNSTNDYGPQNAKYLYFNVWSIYVQGADLGAGPRDSYALTVRPVQNR